MLEKPIAAMAAKNPSCNIWNSIMLFLVKISVMFSVLYTVFRCRDGQAARGRSEQTEVHQQQSCAQTSRQACREHGGVGKSAEHAYVMAVEHVAHRIDVRNARNEVEHARAYGNLRCGTPSEEMASCAYDG